MFLSQSFGSSVMLGTVFERYNYLPTGARDTYAQHRMRRDLRPSERRPVTGEEAWAAMHPIARQQLVLAACGARAGDLHLKAWTDIDAHDRLRIGSAARQRAECLR